MNLSFEGRSAVVTGGASGIGLAAAKCLRDLGAKVAVIDLSADVANVDFNCAAPCDVTDAIALEACCDAIESAIGEVDVLVHAAGVLQRPLAPDRLKLSEWDRALNVNLRGTYVANRAFGARMARRGRGSIVNVASVAGVLSGPLLGYGPAKAGVVALTQSLAVEWGRKGVRVTCVSPGFTETPALKRGVDAGVMHDEAMGYWTALGRLVSANEVAHAIAFLASDLAAAITGVNVPVDAGYLAAAGWGPYGGPRADVD